jgi:hypothetical protein
MQSRLFPVLESFDECVEWVLSKAETEFVVGATLLKHIRISPIKC